MFRFAPRAQRLSALGLATACLVPAAWAAPKPAPKSPPTRSAQPAATPPAQWVRELEGIREYRLANGLQVLLFPDAAASTSFVNIVYRVGSRHEGAGEAGMAHLLEHLLFKGTPTVADIPKAMSERGVRWNATTSVDRTNYFSSFNANADTLGFILALEAERMQRSRVEAADLAQEMPVVLNEMERGENSPGQLLRERLQAAAYRFHPYGRLTIGSRSDLENVPIEALRRFYRAHYRPDNATLMVSGQFDPSTVLAQIQQHFGPLANPPGQAPAPYTVEPPQDGERSVVLRQVGGQAFSLIGYHVPNFAHPDCAALELLGPMLFQAPSGPLYKRLVEGKQASQLLAGGCGGHDPGLFLVAALPSGPNAEALTAALLKELEGDLSPLLEAEQLKRAKAQLAQRLQRLLKQPQELMQGLTEAVAAGDWRLFFKFQQGIQAVTLEDLQRVARQYLLANNRTVARLETVRTSSKVLVPVWADRQQGLDALATAQSLSGGERLDPAPLHLQTRTRFSTLAHSGLPLAWLDKQTRGDQVFGRIQLRWGDGAELQQAHEAPFVAQVVTEGTLGMSKQQLEDEALRLKGQFTLVSGPQGLTLSLEGERSGFGELLRLAFRVLKSPSFPTEAWPRHRGGALQSLQATRLQPEPMRQAGVREHYNQARQAQPGDARYLPSLDDRIGWIQAIQSEQLQAFHARYWSANEGEAAFVGPAPEGIEALLDAELAAWKKPAAPRFKRLVLPYQPVPAAQIHVQVADRAAAALQVRQELQFPADHPDEAALVLANHLLGGGSLESRLNVRLRQQAGLSYGIESKLHLPEWGDAGNWTLRTQLAPEKRLQVEANIRAVLKEVLEQGFSDADVERARHDVLQGRLQRRAAESTLVHQLGKLLEHGKDWRDTAEWDERYRRVSAAEVNAALRHYLRPEQMVWSSAGDYAAKPPK